MNEKEFEIQKALGTLKMQIVKVSCPNNWAYRVARAIEEVATRVEVPVFDMPETNDDNAAGHWTLFATVWMKTNPERDILDHIQERVREARSDPPRVEVVSVFD